MFFIAEVISEEIACETGIAKIERGADSKRIIMINCVTSFSLATEARNKIKKFC